jgi:hypothetical protein
MQTLEPTHVSDDGIAELAPSAPRRPRPRAIRVGTVLRWVAAAALLGAAGIHFAMMGEHAGVSWTHGTFFAVVAWLQVALAGLLVLRPTRTAVLGGVVVNVGVLGVWVVSRTVGIAIGGDGTPEAWGTVDLVCAAFEGVAVLACLGLLAPRLARRPLSSGVGAASIAFVGIAVAVVTALVFSPAFLEGAGASGVSADGHHHGAAGETGAAHSHAAPVDDKGLAALSNGHHHTIGPEQPLSAAERALLSEQVAGSVEVAKRLPTVAAAVAAGYTRAGPFSPGLGAHFIKPSAAGLNADGVVDADDVANPMSIIYDGIAPDSKVAGFMYYSMSPTTPEGFAGPNDIWHFHTNTCVVYGPNGIDAPFGADTTVTKAMCDGQGGTLMEKTQYMVHVWSVPGWESQQGLFGEVNPALSCPDGSYHMWPKRQWADHLDNVCRSA